MPDNPDHYKKAKIFEQVVKILAELNNCVQNTLMISQQLKDLFLKLDVDGVRSLAKNTIEHFGKNTYNKLVADSLKDSTKTYDAIYNKWSTKKLFEMCGAYNPAMKIDPLPNTIEMEGKKLLGQTVTFTTGKIYQVQKIMDLVDKPNSEQELKNILGELISEDCEIIKKELALKLVYTYNKNIQNTEKCSNINQIVNKVIGSDNMRSITINDQEVTNLVQNLNPLLQSFKESLSKGSAQTKDSAQW